jgi:CRP/FNR family transcriptional regulator, cyclic AMP receptor protein
MEKFSDPNSLDWDDELLKKFKLFAELSDDELKTLLQQSARSHHAAGDRIISAGESGLCMYVILKGKVQVSTQGEGCPIALATLGGGDFFGEVSLVDDGPRSADVTALEDCEFLVITRMTLGILAGLQPGAAIHILAAIGRGLVARLRAGNQKYMDLIVLSRQLA